MVWSWFLNHGGSRFDHTTRITIKFYANEAIFLIASTVGKPLVVDMVTRNHTRPSYASVKIEVDLVTKLPHRIKINEENDVTGKIKSKWVYVQYDHKTK